MKSRLFVATVGTAILAVCFAPFAAMAKDDVHISIEEMIPVYAQTLTVNEEFPEELDLAALGDFNVGSVRFLGTSGVANHWVARSGGSDVCLISHIPGGNEVAASTCGPITEFYQTGLGLRVEDGNESFPQKSEGYLVPADIKPSEIHGSLLSLSEGAAFFAVSPDDSPLKKLEISRNDGRSFEFAPLSSGR